MQSLVFCATCFCCGKQDRCVQRSMQSDIVKETKYFYEHLYKQEEQINDVNLEKNIIQEQKSIPKLTEEQCNSLEGKISKDEVLSTLKRMKNGTSPGSDGFTVEFFKFFWNDIGTLLVRAINESFRKESLSSPQKEGLITLLPNGDKPRQFLKKLETNHSIKCVI